MLARREELRAPGDDDIRLAVLQLDLLERASAIGCPARSGRAAKERPDSRQELFEGERLDDVVVRPCVERLDARSNGIAGGQDEDRYEKAALANAGEELDAVEVREAEVEDQRVGDRLVERPLRRGGGDRHPRVQARLAGSPPAP